MAARLRKTEEFMVSLGYKAHPVSKEKRRKGGGEVRERKGTEEKGARDMA